MMEYAAALLSLGKPLFSLEEARSFSEECGLSLQEGTAHLIAPALGLDPEGNAEDREFFEKWLKPSLHESRREPYVNDPYFKTVPFHGQSRGKWCYGTESLSPMELFAEGDMALAKAGRVLPQLGFFTEKYEFPAVFEEGADWMSLAPNETLTLREPVARAHGRVLTYGLGLGYYVFMAARKDSVLSVTAVERSREAAELFRENLLPHFPHPEKITVVEADALDFASRLEPGAYDAVFADIWRDAGDGIPLYLALKRFETRSPGTDFSYWIEKSMDLYLDETLWP